jgi:predicted transcriptional regulator
MTLKTPSSILLVSPKRKINDSKKNRTRIRSLGDVLQVIREAGLDGIVISNISRKANLSHNPTVEHCSKLISAGLIKLTVVDKRQVYVITQKGQEFFREYQNFQSLVEPLNLKY